MVRPSAVSHWKTPGEIAQFIDESSVRIGDVERLYSLQTRPPRRRFVHPVRFQTSAISDDDKRTRCHEHSLTKKWPRMITRASYLYKLIRLSRQDCVA